MTRTKKSKNSNIPGVQKCAPGSPKKVKKLLDISKVV